ncbi:hypothetical protein VZT92_025783 [Zoarces viviparus]|uniref:Uncharacterized protein n=1 Tax=Zoarces viviparus TaxID=48416 RepID=A0AAW1DY49_ZOAVI
MPKTLFLSQENRARSDGNEGVRAIALFHRGNSGWIEWSCVACVTLARSQSRGTGSVNGILGGYKPSSVCPNQTTIRHFIQMAQQAQAPPTGNSEGYVRSASVLHPYHSNAFAG